MGRRPARPRLIVSRAPMTVFGTGILLALVSAVCWSLFDVTRRLMAARLTTWALVFWVSAGALPVVGVWGAVSGWGFGPGYWSVGLASTVLNVVANFAFFRALQISPLSLTLPLLSLTPVFSSALGAVVLHQPLSLRAAGGIGLVVAGASLLSTSGSRNAAGKRRLEPGSLLMGGVALLWSATLLLDRLALEHSTAPFHALILNAGVALGSIVALAPRRRLSELGELRGVWWVLVGAIGAGVAALAFQLEAIQRAPIGIVDTLKRGVGGPLAVLWGHGLFHEPVTSAKLWAVSLMGAGVALILL